MILALTIIVLVLFVIREVRTSPTIPDDLDQKINELKRIERDEKLSDDLRIDAYLARKELSGKYKLKV